MEGQIVSEKGEGGCRVGPSVSGYLRMDATDNAAAEVENNPIGQVYIQTAVCVRTKK